MGEFEDDTVASPAAADDGQDQLKLGEAEADNATEGSVEAAPDEDADDEVAEMSQAELGPDAEVDAEDAPAGVEGDADTEPAPADEEPEAETPPSDEDLAAAVEASNEQVGAESTLDDIVPGNAQIVPDGEIASDSQIRYGAPWWPFLIYLALWFVFAGLAVWQFEQLPPAAVLYETKQYTLFVFGGLVLAAAGVLLIIAVWLGVRVTGTRQRTGLFSSAFIKGALAILIGVVVWWGTIMALDYLRLGRFI